MGARRLLHLFGEGGEGGGGFGVTGEVPLEGIHRHVNLCFPFFVGVPHGEPQTLVFEADPVALDAEPLGVLIPLAQGRHVAGEGGEGLGVNVAVAGLADGGVDGDGVLAGEEVGEGLSQRLAQEPAGRFDVGEYLRYGGPRVAQIGRGVRLRGSGLLVCGPGRRRFAWHRHSD
jgi:hypothetical protein